MAVKADGVLVNNRRRRVGAEIDRDRRPFLATPHAASVLAARAVAGLALQLAMAKRSIGIGGYGMGTAEKRESGLLFVARQAGVRALATVFSLLATGGAGSQGR